MTAATPHSFQRRVHSSIGRAFPATAWANLIEKTRGTWRSYMLVRCEFCKVGKGKEKGYETLMNEDAIIVACRIFTNPLIKLPLPCRLMNHQTMPELVLKFTKTFA
jgi:hypothetical protein